MNFKYPIKNIHSLSVDEVINNFQTDALKGISKAEADKRRREFGANVYQSQKQKSLWEILLHQFKSPIVYLLVAGSVVALYFNDYIDAIAIIIVVLVNADFPRKKKNIGSPEMVKRNEALAEQYNKQGMFPLTLLLNADGKVLKSWSGKPEVSPEQWTAEIKAICNSNK